MGKLWAAHARHQQHNTKTKEETHPINLLSLLSALVPLRHLIYIVSLWVYGLYVVSPCMAAGSPAMQPAAHWEKWALPRSLSFPTVVGDVAAIAYKGTRVDYKPHMLFSRAQARYVRGMSPCMRNKERSVCSASLSAHKRHVLVVSPRAKALSDAYG